MRWGLVTFLAIATVVLVAIAWLQSGGAKQHAIFSAVTPEEAVQALMSQIQAHNYQQAYASLIAAAVRILHPSFAIWREAPAACVHPPRCKARMFRLCTPIKIRLWSACE